VAREEKMACPACAGTQLRQIYALPSIPVQSCILLDSEADAKSFPTAPLRLKFCHECGFVFNAVFDLDLVDYASTTEESQHFSGTFSRFAKKLASEIAGHWEMRGKTTLEIGCGKGEFLLELAEQTGTIGLGVDPGFIPERLGAEGNVSLSFQREFFDPATIEITPDFIACRHTLEHIPDVQSFMADITKTLDQNMDTGVFFETPDVMRVLEEGAFWDIYYEHCSYFTLGSHARLFRAVGMDVTKLYLDYDDQYIIQYAQTKGATEPLPQEDDLAKVRSLVEDFEQLIQSVRDHWVDYVRSRASNGKRVAIWGGGSKCVSFLTTNALGDEVATVIDINPFKQGKYLPITAHQVQSPESLKENPPDTVIIMNPVYVEEITAQLRAMGLDPEVVAV